MARKLSRNPHVDPWKKASTGIMNVPTFDRFKPGEDKGLSDPSWGGGKLGAVSTGAGENLQRTLKPIARILPTMQEHAQHGWEGMTGEYEDVPWSKGWESLNEPVGRGLGAFQTLMSPISGAYTALFDEPVSETLQQYGGMDKETADMAAMGLGVALPLGWLGFSKWAKINPFATEVLAEKLFGKTMPGTHWARGTVDTDQTRRNILKAGAVTAGATAAGGPAARGLIGKAGARVAPIVAKSPVLTTISGTLATFVRNLSSANERQIADDVAARQRARDSGSSRVAGETMDDEARRIRRNVENDNWETVLYSDKNREAWAIDEVFHEGPQWSETSNTWARGRNGLNQVLEDEYVTSQSGRTHSAWGEAETTPGRVATDAEYQSWIRQMVNEGYELDLATDIAKMKRLWGTIPDTGFRPGLEDRIMRSVAHRPPWSEDSIYRSGDPRFMDESVNVYNKEVAGRTDHGYTAQTEKINEWDETLRAIEWYQKNDPETLIRVLREQRELWNNPPDGRATRFDAKFDETGSYTGSYGSEPGAYPYDHQIKVLDNLIAETEALIKPLQKVERGRAPGPGSLQQRLDRAAAERARQAAKKDKKKEDGFSWLDPMGWRKHPWFGGKE